MRYTYFMHLKTNITSNIELTEAITSYFDKRMEVLEKFIPTHEHEAILIQADLGRSTNHHKHGDVFRAEVVIKRPRKDIYAVSEKEDLYSAIDDVQQELLSELKTIKGKDEANLKKGGLKLKEMMRGFGNLFRRRK